MKRMGENWRSDTGAALVTVLLLVAVMAAGAAVTFEALGYSVKRTTARRMYDQAHYYALGGEQLAVAAAEKISRFNRRTFVSEAVAYPIDNGRIEGVLSDASNCFNINSLVEPGKNGALVANADGGLRFERLLGLIGFSDMQATGLRASLTDWLDSDSQTLPQGAEDYDYASMAPPYRAANTLMADLTELYLVQGFGAEVMDSLKPFVCVGTGVGPAKLNVNSLQVADAPLLAALVGGDFTLAAATDVIATRPARAYDDVGDFWRERVFEGRPIDQAVRGQVAVKAQRFESRIRVRFADATAHITSVIELDKDGVGHVAARRYGVVQ